MPLARHREHSRAGVVGSGARPQSALHHSAEYGDRVADGLGPGHIEPYGHERAEAHEDQLSRRQQPGVGPGFDDQLRGPTVDRLHHHACRARVKSRDVGEQKVHAIGQKERLHVQMTR